MTRLDYREKSLPRKVEAILFDFDGTLISFIEKWWHPLERSFIKINGKVPEETLRANLSKIMADIPMKPSKIFLLKIMFNIGRAGGLSRVQSLKFLRVAKEEFDKSRYINIPHNGVEDLLNQLREKGYKLGIVTSANDKEMNQAIIDLPFIKDLALVTRDDVDDLKPAAEPIEKGMKLIGSSPEHTLYVGDFGTDVEAGKAAGTMTCAILGPVPEISRSGLEGADPDIIIDEIKDLLAFV